MDHFDFCVMEYLSHYTARALTLMLHIQILNDKDSGC